jgi:hypothetical protein
VLDPIDGTLELKRPVSPKYWRPVLSPEGSAIAWIDSKRVDSKIGTKWWVRLRMLDGTGEKAIPLIMKRPASIELLADDGRDVGFLARRNGREFVSISPKGGISPLSDAPRPNTQPTQGYQRLPHGWISWDIYRDKGRHRIAWNLHGQAGRLEVPKGRGINAVSVSADEQLIAVSVGPNTRIGTVKDAIFVIRAHDRTEVYRRYFAPYSRSRPVFLGSRHLAVTTIADGKPTVELLRIPKFLATAQ